MKFTITRDVLNRGGKRFIAQNGIIEVSQEDGEMLQSFWFTPIEEKEEIIEEKEEIIEEKVKARTKKAKNENTK